MFLSIYREISRESRPICPQIMYNFIYFPKLIEVQPRNERDCPINRVLDTKVEPLKSLTRNGSLNLCLALLWFIDSRPLITRTFCLLDIKLFPSNYNDNAKHLPRTFSRVFKFLFNHWIKNNEWVFFSKNSSKLSNL